MDKHIATLKNFTLDPTWNAPVDFAKPRHNICHFDIQLHVDESLITLNDARLVSYVKKDENDVVQTSYFINSTPRFTQDQNGRSQTSRTLGDGSTVTTKGNWEPTWVINDPYLLNAILSVATAKYRTLASFAADCPIDSLPLLKEIKVLAPERPQHNAGKMELNLIEGATTPEELFT